MTQGPQIIVLDSGLGQPLTTKDTTQSITTKGSILSISGNNYSAVKTLAANLNTPDGVDIFSSRLYWSEMGIPSANDGRVLSSALDGSDIQTIIPAGKIHTPKQLIVEPMSQKIYVCDREGLRVFRCNLDGSDLEVIVQTGDFANEGEKQDMSRWCVGIAVSPKLNTFFWTQKGTPKGGQGRIFSANIETPLGATSMNRKDIECLFSNLPEPIDLEIDESTNTLYWTDRGELPFGNTLNKVQLDESGGPILQDGLTNHTIISQNFNEAIGLKLDKKNGVMYVSDFGGAVWKVSLDGKKKEQVYEDVNAAFTGLALLEA